VVAPPRVNWRGAWLATAQYQINDAVSFEGAEEGAAPINSYIAVRLPPIGTKPTDRSFWETMSSSNEIQSQASFIAACISASAALASVIVASVTAAAAWANLKAQAAKAGLDAGKALGDVANLANQMGNDIKKVDQELGKERKRVDQEIDNERKRVDQEIGNVDKKIDQVSGQAKRDRTLSDQIINSIQQTEESKLLKGSGDWI
jgi:hypothetical protein